MAISFPSNPNVNDTFTVDDKTFLWTGDYWRTLSSAVTFPGIIKDADNDTKVEVEASSDEDVIRFRTAGTERLQLTSDGHLIPQANVTYDLGSASNRFRDLYLSGSSIDLGGTTISSDGTSLTMPPMASLEVGNTSVSNNKITLKSANNTSAIVDMLSDNSGTKGFRLKYEGNGNYFAIADVESGVITDHFTIDFNGYVKTPNQPAFSALMKGMNETTDATAPIILKPNTVTVNVGNCYSTSTGAFTAPTSGRYMFYHSAFDDNSSGGTASARFRVNGVNTDYRNYTSLSETSTYKPVNSISAIFSLATNDTVDVNLTNGIYHANQNAMFLGFLIG